MNIDITKYIFRDASLKDVDFLAQTVIESEKSSSGKCGMANYFGITEEMLHKYLVQIFEEEIDGCELSVSSFIVAEYDGKCVAAKAGWIEGDNEDNQPSSILKSNLFSYVLPKEIIMHGMNNAPIVKDLVVEKEMGAFQFEYTYVIPEHRGMFLSESLGEEHFKRLQRLNKKIRKSQCHAFLQNKATVLSCKISHYKIVKTYHSSHPRILEFYPYDTIVLMEKEFNQ